MAKKKKGLYVVISPEFTGTVQSLKEYNKYVVGKKQAKGKKVANEAEANEWIAKNNAFLMSGKTKTVPKAAVKPIVQKVAKQGQVVMYIDGGYKEPIGTYGIVAYATKGTYPIHRDFGYVYDERLNSLKNTGAELMACIRALEWAFANHYTQVTIIYDYEGIINHLDKAPSTEGTTLYYEMIQRFKQTMDIHFLHIRHGNKVLHNEAHNLTQMTI